jgi:predicted TIM-barrel fold metal-dependent hydrolase
MTVTDLADHVAGVPLIDQHAHGCWVTAGDRSRFENALNEANTDTLADFDSGFDTQVGFAIRAHCAPLLGLPEHADPQDYWQRRSQLTETDLARIFLQAAGVSDWLIDTGYADGVSDVAQLADCHTAERTRSSASKRWPKTPPKLQVTTPQHLNTS